MLSCGCPPYANSLLKSSTPVWKIPTPQCVVYWFELEMSYKFMRTWCGPESKSPMVWNTHRVQRPDQRRGRQPLAASRVEGYSGRSCRPVEPAGRLPRVDDRARSSQRLWLCFHLCQNWPRDLCTADFEEHMSKERMEKGSDVRVREQQVVVQVKLGISYSVALRD